MKSLIYLSRTRLRRISLLEAKDYINRIDPDSAKALQKIKVDWNVAKNKNSRNSMA